MADTPKPKLQQKANISEVLTEAVRHRAAEATTARKEVSADPRFANIAANAFFKVMFAENTRPEAKRAEVAKLLTFEGTKEENRERIKGIRAVQGVSPEPA
jgi:hypothetical protein